MSNMIPFDSKNLPAHLRSIDAKALNADLISHAATGGFPVISIKGKVFAVKRDGVRNVLSNPKDPDSAATSIEVVLLKVNKNTSKVFYASGWKEGDDSKPTCSSNDGKTPDATIENPQSKSCTTCSHNQWGSKISDSGTKLKSCADSIRMAVAAPDQLNEPMLLRVPAASMRAVAEYGGVLAKRNVPYTAVVTKIAFDIEAPTPKLLFRATSYMSQEMYAEAKESAESDIVDNIINGNGLTIADTENVEPRTSAEKVISKASKSSEFSADEIDDCVNRVVGKATPYSAVLIEEDGQEDGDESAPTPKKAKPVAKKTKPAEHDVDIDISLDDLNFDD